MPDPTPGTRLVKAGYQIPWSAMTHEQAEKVKTQLTIPKKSWLQDGPAEKVVMYSETKNYLVVPRWYGRKLFGIESKSLIAIREYGKFRKRYTGPCRPNQKTMVRSCLRGMEEHGGGLLVAGCGTGKTNMAIMLAIKLGLKTLFVAHDTDLLRQFRERLYSTTNVRSVGLIQRKTIDVNHHFIVGTLQSIVKVREKGKEYPPEIFADIGLLIIDEMHHIASPTFRRIFKIVCPKYIFGMSAENSRSDGLFSVIVNNIGPILHEEPVPPDSRVWVKRILFRWEKPIPRTTIRGKPNKADYGTMATMALNNYRRNKTILSLIRYYVNRGRDILVLSARREHVTYLHQKLEDSEYQGMSGVYMGDMKEEDKKVSLVKQVVIATLDKAREGLDVPNLTVLIMCVSGSNVRQPTGRILRKKDPGCHPIIVDMVDLDNEDYAGQAEKRVSYYQRNEYQIDSLVVSEERGDEYYGDEKRMARYLEKKPRGKKEEEKRKELTAEDYVFSDSE